VNKNENKTPDQKNRNETLWGKKNWKKKLNMQIKINKRMISKEINN